MTDLERYLFDLQGFLIIENALNSDQIAVLQALLDRQIARQDNPEAPFLRFDGLLPWGQPLRELIDNPAIAPYLSELVGKQFRLDHDYVHIIRQGLGPIGSPFKVLCNGLICSLVKRGENLRVEKRNAARPSV
jgi:hypothetical protein